MFVVGPQTVEILGADDPLSSGRDHLLSCLSSGSRPPPRVSWWWEGRRLKHSTQKVPTKCPTMTDQVLSFRLLTVGMWRGLSWWWRPGPGTTARSWRAGWRTPGWWTLPWPPGRRSYSSMFNVSRRSVGRGRSPEDWQIIFIDFPSKVFIQNRSTF